jgi:hypothetical protein
MSLELYSAAINDRLREADLPLLDEDDKAYIGNMYDLGLEEDDCAEYLITQRIDQRDN